jgi:hypothetical protein
MEDVGRPYEESVPGRLLATLLSQNSLVQPEVVLTRATHFLLGLPGGSSALDSLVARCGLDPEPGGYWRTEVRGVEGGRTDLEYRWGDLGALRVIVEAKIGHILDSGQVDAYRSRLGKDGLLAVLVPIARRGEGLRVVEDLRRDYEQVGDPIRVCLWTWDEVVAALESALDGGHDVVQLRGLVDAAGALDIRPFDEPELNTANDSRFDDLWTVLDRASWQLFDRTYRAQSGGPFTHYRHVSVGDYDAGFTVGIGRQGRTDAESWVWARIADTTHLGGASQEAIKRHRPDAVRDGDGLAFPLALEPGLSGDELTQAIRQQLEDAAALIREGLRESLEELNLATVPADPAVLEPLVGMSAFASADLLDSSTERRRDLEKVARQVARHVAQGGRATFAGSPPFALRFWIPVHPYTTFLSIGIERTDDPGSPQPWVWLTLHQGTPRATEALQALEAAFPGEVVPIPEGWGIPMGIPEGGSGVVAFEAFLSRVEQARAALRNALHRIDSVE